MNFKLFLELFLVPMLFLGYYFLKMLKNKEVIKQEWETNKNATKNGILNLFIPFFFAPFTPFKAFLLSWFFFNIFLLIIFLILPIIDMIINLSFEWTIIKNVLIQFFFMQTTILFAERATVFISNNSLIGVIGLAMIISLIFPNVKETFSVLSDPSFKGGWFITFSMFYAIGYLFKSRI